MRRSLQDARRALEEDLAPTLTDRQLREAQAFMSEAEASARTEAQGHIAAEEREGHNARNQALRALTQVRDRMEELIEEGRSGRVTSEEMTTQLRELTHLQGLAERELDGAS